MTEAEAEHSGFPIIGDVDRNGFTGRGPDLFASVAGQKLATVVPEARAAIERLQPFYEGPAWAFNPLWILNALARIDRHRFLHLAAIQSGSLRLDPAHPGHRDSGSPRLGRRGCPVELCYPHLDRPRQA